MQRGTKGAVIGGVCAVVVGAAAYGGYHMYNGMSADPIGHSSAAPKVKTGPLSPTEVHSASAAFLSAWSSGNAVKAAGLTDNVAEASTQLAAFKSAFHATSVTLTPGQPTTATAASGTGSDGTAGSNATAGSGTASTANGTSAAGSSGTGAAATEVPFTVKAAFSYAGQSTAWTYRSALTVVRDTVSGNPVVKWTPSVVYPTLTQGETLQAAVTSAPPTKVVDRRGKTLTGADYPSLSGIISQLRTRYGTKLHGTPGMAIRVKTAAGKPGPVLHALSQGKAGDPLPTTIDASIQAEAEQAVKTEGPDASVVAVQPSTGDILAVADNPATGYNKAMLGQYASGSTFKVITASTLLSTGKYTANSPLACPKTITYGGRTFHNVEGENFSNATTVASDFAASCNTAFISTAAVLPDGAVENEAHDVFGLGLTWSTGVASWDGKVPAGSGSLKASTYIGQGEVQVNPLNMASVAATAKSGVFRQPVIVPVSVDHRSIAVAPRQLSATVDSELRSMMVRTARYGTAAPTISGLSGDVGAKTGTAEVDGQTKPNSWFIAYRDDVAAAAIVPNTGEGYKYAGKIVTAILQAS
jgi:Penicillin binding protein transpeptidase domain